MVAIQETELRERILVAIEKAKKLERSILVSEVHQIDADFNALSFFHSGKERFFGERFFWKDPEEESFLVGLGIGQCIGSDQAADRFFVVEQKWKSLIQESMIDNPFSATGTGPLLFGGFSFDPLKPKTVLWNNFADSMFYLPKYMLSVSKEKVFLTTNVICTKNEDDSLFNKISTERNILIKNAGLAIPNHDPELSEMKEKKPQQWKENVARVVDELKGSGSLKKVVLARELRLSFHEALRAENVLAKLLEEQRSSFIFAFEAHEDCFIGASPERLVKKADKDLYTTCLAGSIPRGKTEKEDNLLGNFLLADEKNHAEHEFVVEMIRSAMADHCEEVIIPEKPALMKMRDIQHLYTPVIGKGNNHTSLLSVVNRLHPTPALGGLPKQEAIEKIREVEDLDRGLYAAPLGWIDYRGDGEFAVAIRSGLIQGTKASLFAGCGVVASSEAESEYLETSIKFRPMLTALGGNEK